MFSTRKYSIRKVSVGIASVLIGIAAGSLGTAYAHEDTNNVVVTAESNHDVNLEHVNKPVLEEVEKTTPASEVVSKPEKKNVSITPATAINKVDNLFKSVLEDKIDWNTIDEKEFVNYLFADIKVDKKKEQEIKEVWLIKVNELLAVNPNNVNLQKVKSILENSLKSKSLVETEKPKEEKLEEVKTNKQEQEKGKLKQEDLNDLLTTKTDFRTDPDPNSEKIANKAADIMQATIEGRNQKMIEESQQPDNEPSYAEQINKQLREAQKEQEQQELNQNNNANLSSQK